MIKKLVQLPEKKTAGFITGHKSDQGAVPIKRRTTRIHLNNKKSIVEKGNHFPVTPECIMIQRDEIVYE